MTYIALAAYRGYASTRNVKIPENTRSILLPASDQQISVGRCGFGMLLASYPVANTALPMIGTVNNNDN